MADSSNRKERARGRADSRRAQRVIEAKRAKRQRTLKMIGGGVAAALVVVAVLVYINRDTTPAAANEPVDPAPGIPEEVEVDGRTLGDPDAPVTVIEYGDFQ